MCSLWTGVADLNMDVPGPSSKLADGMKGEHVCWPFIREKSSDVTLQSVCWSSVNMADDNRCEETAATPHQSIYWPTMIPSFLQHRCSIFACRFYFGPQLLNHTLSGKLSTSPFQPPWIVEDSEHTFDHVCVFSSCVEWNHVWTWGSFTQLIICNRFLTRDYRYTASDAFFEALWEVCHPLWLPLPRCLFDWKHDNDLSLLNNSLGSPTALSTLAPTIPPSSKPLLKAKNTGPNPSPRSSHAPTKWWLCLWLMATPAWQASLSAWLSMSTSVLKALELPFIMRPVAAPLCSSSPGWALIAVRES